MRRAARLGLLALALAAGAIVLYVEYKRSPHATSNVAPGNEASQTTDIDEPAPAASGSQGRTAHTAAQQAATTPAVKRWDPFAGIPGETYAVGNLADDYARLTKLADGGDLLAARTLERTLVACSYAVRTQHELDALLAKIADPNYRYDAHGGGEQRRQHEVALFEHCRGIDNAHIADRGKWIAQLAAAGDLAARLEFAQTGQPDPMRTDYDELRADFLAKAHGYLDEEIAHGEIEALIQMGFGYLPRDPSNGSPVFGADAMTAYAYYYAYGLAGGDRESFVVENGKATDITTMTLANLESRLTSAQIEQARQRGAQIYAQCCAGK
jgi:hypothetical protein